MRKPLAARQSPSANPLIFFCCRTLQDLQDFVGKCCVALSISQPNFADFDFEFWTEVPSIRSTENGTRASEILALFATSDDRR
jgi:hypothetical protein